jgi:hypothetical protein
LTRTRGVLLAAAGLAVIVIVARLALGPFRLLWPVTTPVNVEGFLGLVLTVLYLSGPRGERGEPPAGRTSRWFELALAGVVALVAAAAFSRSLNFPFYSDDFIIVQRSPTQTLAVLGRFFLESGDRTFFRPLGAIVFTLTSLWAGMSPFRWHVSALVLHATTSILVLRLARTLGASRYAGLLAGLLFAVHGTRPEVMVWLADTFDLLATPCVLGGMLLFLRSRNATGRTRWCYTVLALVCTILALLSKEAAYIFPLLLLLYVVLHRGGPEGRIRAVLPFFAAALVLFVYRWSVLGGIGGYPVSGTGLPQAFSLDLAFTLKAVFVRMWATLYFPINWSVDPGAILASLTAAYTICLVWLATRTKPAHPLLFPIGWTLIAVIPPLPLLVIGPDLWNSRVLYLASVGFCLFLALVADRAGAVVRPIVLVLMLAFHVAALQHNLDSWQYAGSKVQSACAVAAEHASSSKRILVTGLPMYVRGVPSFANGFQECVELRLARKVDVAVLWGAAQKADHEPDATLLRWDSTSEQLQCTRACVQKAPSRD